MPFDQKNMEATHQKMVNMVFKDQLGKNIELYLNDLVVKSRRETIMMSDVAETLMQLRKYNIKLNPSGCAFGVIGDFKRNWGRTPPWSGHDEQVLGEGHATVWQADIEYGRKGDDNSERGRKAFEELQYLTWVTVLGHWDTQDAGGREVNIIEEKDGIEAKAFEPGGGKGEISGWNAVTRVTGEQGTGKGEVFKALEVDVEPGPLLWFGGDSTAEPKKGALPNDEGGKFPINGRAEVVMASRRG
ncbi:hypothetical protein E3N88_38585 [Mikania micrantha]|uniref:Reverse transcriptase domain-containing protein n=1 Tax=Mikania micrantha TaxID=192012 RepID=A0A5N6LUE0_9ASTR|nr:hypothetical protein E3N88_38585 [Mikania micrantha]